MELEYIFQWPPAYPQALLDSVEEEVQPVIKQWAWRTLEALQGYLRTYPERAFAMSLEGMGTSQHLAGEPVCVFLIMTLYRKVLKPEIVCFIGSKESLEAERDRIIAKVKAESIARKINTAIAQGYGPH
jgi:hypothetical protein